MSGSRSHRHGGFALLCVLWALAVLTILSVGFGRRALLDRRAAAMSIDHVQARGLARGALERAIVEVEMETAAREAVLTSMRGAQPAGAYLGGRSGNLFAGDGVFADAEAARIGDVCGYTVHDCESRISLNAAPEELLDEVPGLSFRMVASIIDRRESALDPDPVLPFLTVEEMLNIDDINKDDWLGGEDEPGLNTLFTVWGDGRVNVNTASAEVLRCIPDVSDGVVEAMVSYRAGPDGRLRTKDDRFFSDYAEISRELGVSPEDLEPLARFCKLESQYFTITAFATRRQGAVTASCRAVVFAEEGYAYVVDRWEGASAPEKQ